ncbi:tyrosine-type recombinase/integrase [Neoaquamicrobium sediminum]|uniref:tyrosine-type recombinase/integrase n=1 Tax=Neoaquamicrobium sediminum TaxID=1849104 RepID=UPI0035E44BDD
MALCYPRPVELRKAEWSHIDLKGKRWTVPAHLTKMRREHIIPLSRQAVTILEAVQKFSGKVGLCFRRSAT